MLCFNTGQGLLAFAVNCKDEIQTGVRVEAGVMTFNKLWSFISREKPVNLSVRATFSVCVGGIHVCIPTFLKDKIK